ncbi:MAG: NAD(P)/FAD-dependent oxidoreductase [Thermoleophilaceae bacterium]
MPADPELPSRADIVVVGAGHNGLVAACYLAKAGLDVLVLGASPVLGGMAATNPIFPESPGHMINEGSIQASIFRATPIESELQLARHGLRQIAMDSAFAQLGPDGSSLGLWNDVERTAAEIRRFSPSDARAWLERSRTCDAAMDVVAPYINMHPTRPGVRAGLTLLAKAGRNARLMADFGRLCLSSMAEVVDEHFTSPLVRGFASALALEPMTQPGSAMDLLWLGLHQRLGSSMFEGGTGALPKALYACLTDHGGTVRTSAKVAKAHAHPVRGRRRGQAGGRRGGGGEGRGHHPESQGGADLDAAQRPAARRAGRPRRPHPDYEHILG